MSVIEGNFINFYQGTKENLLKNLSEMSEGDLAVATDEMQWYMAKTVNEELTLCQIGGNNS